MNTFEILKRVEGVLTDDSIKDHELYYVIKYSKIEVLGDLVNVISDSGSLILKFNISTCEIELPTPINTRMISLVDFLVDKLKDEFCHQHSKYETNNVYEIVVEKMKDIGFEFAYGSAHTNFDLLTFHGNNVELTVSIWHRANGVDLRISDFRSSKLNNKCSVRRVSALRSKVSNLLKQIEKEWNNARN